MADVLLEEIVATSLELAKKAATTYAVLGNLDDQDTTSEFWQQMSLDSIERIALWEKLMELMGKGEVRETPNRLVEIRDDLLVARDEIETLLICHRTSPTSVNPFLLAYCFELHLFRPTFDILFRLLRGLTGESTLDENYHAHLNRCLTGLKRFGPTSHEFNLLTTTMSRLLEAHATLVAQEFVDGLTGVFNRHGFFVSTMPLAYVAQRNGSTSGIMLLDIDYLKMLSDAYGHETGDRIIALVGATVKSTLRRSDVIGRFGGDEFIVYLSSVDPNFLWDLADKLRGAIEIESQKILPVTVSVGVSHGLLDKDIEQTMDRLISKADECLYQAKLTGKNKVVMGSLT